MNRTKSIHKLYELWDRPGISERIDRWRPGFTAAMTEEFFEQITETLLALEETERAGHWISVIEDPQIVAMLLKAGANQDIRNARGQSALEIARIRGATDLESLLLSAGQ